MTSRPDLKTIDTTMPDEEAARWLILREQQTWTASDQARFDRWLAADPRNDLAFRQAQAACGLAQRHAAAPEIMKMRHAALAARGERHVQRWRMVASILVIGVALGALYLWMPRATIDALQRGAVSMLPDVSGAPHSTSIPTHYSTAIGERATISLPDGSVATLDTQSSLDVMYSDTERGIKLIHGQAYFEVAKHKVAPFQVYAAGRRITAVGTAFDVRLDGERLRVALIEGKVRVATTPMPGEPYSTMQVVTMAPGDMLDAQASAPMSVTMADTKRSTSWRDGVAVFLDTRLADAVAEMNRYSSTSMIVADVAAADYRLSGVFKTGDPDHFAESVISVLPVSITHQSDGTLLLRTRGP